MYKDNIWRVSGPQMVPKEHSCIVACLLDIGHGKKRKDI